MPEEHPEDTGIVKEISGKLATVEIIRGGGCKSCQMHGLCFRKNEPVSFSIQTELALQPGDRVQLDIAPEGRVLASLLIFGLPLLALFAGFIVSSTWLIEIAAIAVGFLSMAISFIIIRQIDKLLGQSLKVSIKEKL